VLLLKTLIIGAGAIGGYFGGRLVEAGKDVTFLVRENRFNQLNQSGLVIKSVHGDFATSDFQMILPGQNTPPVDLVIIAVKTHHLENALESVTPYINSQTVILPLMNGYSHIEKLKSYFGEEKVIGGLCFIESTLNQEGEILQTSDKNDILFGELDCSLTSRIKRIHHSLSDAVFLIKPSSNIELDLWNKYIFITALSGITTLMNSAIGPILEREDGRDIYNQLINELISVAKAENIPINDDKVHQINQMTKSFSYTMKSSMLRDVEKELPVEVESIQGYFLEKAKFHSIMTPVLEIVYSKLKIYEKNRIG
jgi:2-dehydropantoate 2-reductase